MSIIGGMKKLYTAFIVFMAALVAVAVYYSPLAWIGTPAAYDNNARTADYDGVCYPAGEVMRVDISGGENELRAALDKLCCTVVKEVRDGERLYVYAVSPRVCAKTQYLKSGEGYNVMATAFGGKVCIGTPVLQGCY